MTMTTNRSKKTPAPSVDETVIVEEAKAPVNVELETPSYEPVEAPKAEEPVKIQTDVREKLSKRSDKNDPFVPTNPAALEKAATEVAKEQGFELNRGTSVGARLIARSRNL